MTFAIIVHGGASEVPPEKADAYKAGCLAAARAGWAVLEQEGNALDAVEAAIRVFEDDETFNAARGGMLNADGEVQMDAAIMDGRDLRLGALGAALGLRHPISVARKIMEVGPLVLVADGVTRFAEAQGAEQCDPAELITEEQRQSWEEEEEKLQQGTTQASGHDTVGCVALDIRGNVAVGTSTGGNDHTPPGRLGDSAMPGCGFYADSSLGACAVSGTGEAIMQVTVAKMAVELLDTGVHPDSAAEQVIAMLGERVKGEGGCIMLDRTGRVGWAHNSKDMSCAMMTSEMKEPQVWTKKPSDGIFVARSHNNASQS